MTLLPEWGILETSVGEVVMTGVTIAPRPTSGTFDGAPTIQTPSRAEHGLEGVLLSRVAEEMMLWGRDALQRGIEGGMSDGDYF